MGGYPSVAPGMQNMPYGQAPPSRRRTSSWPFLLLLAIVLVGGMVWAFMGLRPTGERPVATGTTASSTTATTGSSAATTDAGTAPQEARSAIGAVLEAGRGSRNTLVQGVDTYCSKKNKTAGTKLMGEALSGRTKQLAKMNEVGDEPFRAVEGALAARDKLKAALQASAETDQVYVRMADAGTVCSGSSELTQANAKASAAKAAFLAAWNPIMTKATLPLLKEDDI